jgi:hypothetical protein
MQTERQTGKADVLMRGTARLTEAYCRQRAAETGKQDVAKQGKTH